MTPGNTSKDTRKPSVILVGAGALGGALVCGWVKTRAVAASSIIIDPSPTAAIKALVAGYGMQLLPDAPDGAALSLMDGHVPDAVIFALKPQLAPQVLPVFAGLAKHSLSISVMAGIGVASLGKYLGGTPRGGPPRIVRAMPNLASSVGAGMTGLFASDDITAPERVRVEELMQAAGKTVWVASEAAIDFVTAVSGSGPAYYFLLTEALAQAGEKLGLDRETAALLARQSAIGAGALMACDDRAAALLRAAVTSPGGTTEAALRVLDDHTHGLRPLVEEAVKQAAERAAELAQ